MISDGQINVGAIDKLRPILSRENVEALAVYNYIGGMVDLSMLPVVLDYFSVHDADGCLARVLRIARIMPK